MATPARYDIRLVAGDDYEIRVRLLDDGQPIDTGGYTFAAQIRSAPLPNGALLAEFSVTPVTGGAILRLTSAQTEDLRGDLVWDFQSASPLVRTWISGNVLVTPEVTA